MIDCVFRRTIPVMLDPKLLHFLIYSPMNFLQLVKLFFLSFEKLRKRIPNFCNLHRPVVMEKTMHCFSCTLLENSLLTKKVTVGKPCTFQDCADACCLHQYPASPEGNTPLPSSDLLLSNSWPHKVTLGS